MSCCPFRDLCSHYDVEFCCNYAYEACPIFEVLDKLFRWINDKDYDKVCPKMRYIARALEIAYKMAKGEKEGD